MIDFSRLFKDSHINSKNTINRGWVNVNCPFCNPIDTHFNGGFNIKSPRYHCWRCGSHNFIESLEKLLNISSQGIYNLISSYETITNEKEEKKIATGNNLQLPGFPFNDIEKEYLVNRGFDPEYLYKYGVRGGGIAGEWSYRILIPIYYNNVLVSWTGRSICNREQIKEYNIPRYKNLSIEQSVINPKEIFFNLDNSRKDKVILVEGPMDVLRMGSDTICSLGTSVTHSQELFLLNRYKKIFIAFDNEEAAQKKAHKLGMNLVSLGLDVEIVNICEDFNKNDPGELTQEEVDKIKSELEF